MAFGLAAALGATTLQAQSIRPAIFVCHNIATNPQFNNYAAVSSFIVDEFGEVVYVGNYFTNDNPQAIAVAPGGRFLAVTHGTASTTTEDLLVFRIEPDASLTMWAVYATPDSPLDVEWLSDTVVACTETSSDSVNRVHVYKFVESNPIPTRLTHIDMEDIGEFSAYLARHPSGDFLYASDAALFGGSLKIRTFAVNSDDSISFVGDVSFVGDADTSSYPLDVAVSNDGTKVYSAGGIGLLTGGSTHRVHGFSVEPDGQLAPLPGTPFSSPGSSPAHVAITGDSRILLVGHGGDGDIRSFLISDEDGFLTDTNQVISIGGQGDIGAIAVFGNALFATRRYSSTGNPSGLLRYRVNLDGSFTQLGGLIDTHGTASDALAVWAPIPGSQGDINADGAVDELDVEAFVAVLLDQPIAPEHVGRSDLNLDSVADARDIPPFVNHYLNPVVTGACCGPDGSCSILDQTDCTFGHPGATWLGANSACEQCPDPAPVIFEYFGTTDPVCNSPGNTVFLSLRGDHFSLNAQVVLRRSGHPDILPEFVSVFGTDFVDAFFLVGGASAGDWSIVLTNPDGQSATWPQPIVIVDCP